MENSGEYRLFRFFRHFLFYVLSFGPIPKSVAFIMDGNRRYTKSRKLEPGSGHRAGSAALASTLQYCYELGIRYVTIYAFSIDNFKRKPEEVNDVMNLMLEKIEELLQKGSLVNIYGLRINFLGNLDLLREPVQVAAKKLMAETSKNSGPVLSVCVAYTSVHEIVHAIEESCKATIQRVTHGKPKGHPDINKCEGVVSVGDIEQHLFTANCLDPMMLIRTSGETRLSNFLLWQTSFCHLQNPAVLWPNFSLMHLIWAILQFQRAFPHIEKARKGV